MRNIIKSILLVGTLSTSLVVMADTKKETPKPDVTKKAGSGSDAKAAGSGDKAGSGSAAKAGSGSAAGSAAGSGSAKKPAGK